MDNFCSNCGKPMEPEAAFCIECGTKAGEVGPPGGPGPTPAPQSMQGPQGQPTQFPMPMMYYRPPRNPRQMASYAAGAMILISGIFALMFGNLILYWDAWTTDWDPVTDEEINLIDPGPFFSGTMYIVAFAVSLVSTYCCFRLMRYELAVTGPVALLVAYFSVLAYEAFIMVVAVHILIMSIISLALLYYAIPIFSGRKAMDPFIDLNKPAVPPGGEAT